MLIVAGIIAGMSLSVSSDTSYLSSHKDAWFYLEDASGLVEKSGVRMDGIQIGIIKKIKLENGQARIEMSLEGEIESIMTALRDRGVIG